MVCDGVGDVDGADLAARLAARLIKRRWRHILAQDTPDLLLNLVDVAQQLLEETNQALLALGERLAKKERRKNGEAWEEKVYAMTTIALALLSPLHDSYLMTYAHVGDSRIYLLRVNEAIRRLTIDDGYFPWAVHKGKLNEQDALRIDQVSRAEELSQEEREHFDKRNRISQSLGDEAPTFHVDQIELSPGDRVLLCTDGIHDNLTDVELEELLRKGARTTVAKRLLESSIVRSQQNENIHIRAKKDDMSAIVITYHSPQDFTRKKESARTLFKT